MTDGTGTTTYHYDSVGRTLRARFVLDVIDTTSTSAGNRTSISTRTGTRSRCSTTATAR